MTLFDKLTAMYGMIMLPLFPLNYLIDKFAQEYDLKYSWNMYLLNIKIIWERD